MMAPKDAKKAYEHGLAVAIEKQARRGRQGFRKGGGRLPEVRRRLDEPGQSAPGAAIIGPARAALKKAMESDPKLVAPYMELGLLAAKDATGRSPASIWIAPWNWIRSTSRKPGTPMRWPTTTSRKYDAAEKSAREAVKLDPRHVNPRSGYLLGLVLAEKKDYAGAAAELTAYMKLAPNAPDLAQVKDQA